MMCQAIQVQKGTTSIIGGREAIGGYLGRIPRTFLAKQSTARQGHYAQHAV